MISKLDDKRVKSPITLKRLENRLSSAYSLTTGGKFAQAIQVFRNILNSIPLLVLSDKEDLE